MPANDATDIWKVKKYRVLHGAVLKIMGAPMTGEIIQSIDNKDDSFTFTVRDDSFPVVDDPDNVPFGDSIAANAYELVLRRIAGLSQQDAAHGPQIAREALN